MSELQHKWGYCASCVKNIPHFCVPTSRLSRFLNLLSLGYAKSLRFGPWYCVHCETKSFYLADERHDAPRFQSADAEAISRSRSVETPDAEVAQSIGNFLKSDQSLVMRSTRLKRFSEKYRDSVVRRVLAGSCTMAQIRQEKDITEGELTDWIGDLFERMQARLDELEETLDAVPSLRLIGESSADSQKGSIPMGPTVEGRIGGRTEGRIRPR